MPYDECGRLLPSGKKGVFLRPEELGFGILGQENGGHRRGKFTLDNLSGTGLVYESVEAGRSLKVTEDLEIVKAVEFVYERRGREIAVELGSMFKVEYDLGDQLRGVRVSVRELIRHALRFGITFDAERMGEFLEGEGEDSELLQEDVFVELSLDRARSKVRLGVTDMEGDQDWSDWSHMQVSDIGVIGDSPVSGWAEEMPLFGVLVGVERYVDRVEIKIANSAADQKCVSIPIELWVPAIGEFRHNSYEWTVEELDELLVKIFPEMI